jgi:hypothetical protein
MAFCPAILQLIGIIAALAKLADKPTALGTVKKHGFSAALALNLASTYVEVRDENRRSHRTDYRLG